MDQVDDVSKTNRADSGVAVPNLSELVRRVEQLEESMSLALAALRAIAKASAGQRAAFKHFEPERAVKPPGDATSAGDDELGDLLVEGVLSMFFNQPPPTATSPAVIAGTTDQLWIDVEDHLVQAGRRRHDERAFRSAKHFGRRLQMARDRLQAEGSVVVRQARDRDRKRCWRLERHA